MRVRFRHRRSEGGSAVVELVWLGLALLIPLVYVIITLVSVERAAFGATEAARSAGRAFILAPDVGTAKQRAYDAARLALADQGVVLDPGELRFTCHPTPESCLLPGSSVDVRVDLSVALPLAPEFFGDAAASVAVEASHTEVYGTYREGAR